MVPIGTTFFSSDFRGGEMVLLFHFGVSHLTSNVIAAPYFCSPRRALKIALP